MASGGWCANRAIKVTVSSALLTLVQQALGGAFDTQARKGLRNIWPDLGLPVLIRGLAHLSFPTTPPSQLLFLPSSSHPTKCPDICRAPRSLSSHSPRLRLQLRTGSRPLADCNHIHLLCDFCNCSVPWFLHLSNGDNNCVSFIASLLRPPVGTQWSSHPGLCLVSPPLPLTNLYSAGTASFSINVLLILLSKAQ